MTEILFKLILSFGKGRAFEGSRTSALFTSSPLRLLVEVTAFFCLSIFHSTLSLQGFPTTYTPLVLLAFVQFMYPRLSWALLSLSIPYLSLADDVPVAKDERSQILKLDTPGYLSGLASDQESAFILNFTMSGDNRTLLFNDRPMFPFPCPDSPTTFDACPVPSNFSTKELKHAPKAGSCVGTVGGARHELDFARVVSPEDEEDAAKWTAAPTILLDILGASPSGSNNTTLLGSGTQKLIQISLDHATDLPKTYKISNIELLDRPAVYILETPEHLPVCTSRSWRCAETEHYPYYRYFWRQNFDQHGRIGSMRHNIMKNFGELGLHIWERAGIYMAISGGVLAVAAVVSSIALLYRRGRAIQQGYRQFFDTRWMEDWMHAEEGQGLLFQTEKEYDGARDSLSSSRSGSSSSAAERAPVYDVTMKPLPPAPRPSAGEERSSLIPSYEEEQFGQFHSHAEDA
ncbi:uncharacterized protein IWZ02DRAFT_435508 [Phyllosticta citriasiana]|uniref:uncharacterized protein n=1 Tax=Phyllosticta citriasiana TaxID=595635 RepID=UPI0030FD349E